MGTRRAPDEFISLPQAARMMGCTLRHVQRLVRRGRLVARNAGYSGPRGSSVLMQSVADYRQGTTCNELEELRARVGALEKRVSDLLLARGTGERAEQNQKLRRTLERLHPQLRDRKPVS